MKGRRVVQTDFNVFVFGFVIMLVFVIIGMLNKEVEWAVFPGLGTVIGIYFTLAVWADGSLTTQGGATVMAAANGAATSSWNLIAYSPLFLTVVCFLIAVYKVGASLK